MAVFALSVSVLFGATEAEVCRELSAGLQRQSEILATVQNADTAAKALAPLGEVLAKLAALRQGVEDNALWNYIDSTENMKPELTARIRDISKHFSRLEKANYFGNAQLRAVLAPQINPNAAPSSSK